MSLLAAYSQSHAELDRGLRQLAEFANAFNPGQDRDHKGRWTKIGGGTKKAWKTKALDVVTKQADNPGGYSITEVSAEHREALQDVFSFADGNLSTAVTDVHGVPELGATIVKGEIYDADGKKVGKFGRSIRLNAAGDPIVEHNSLVLDSNLQGQGFAQAFNNHLFDWYRDSGVKEVSLHANHDVGGYAWARAGYDWQEKDDVKDVRTRLRANANRGDKRIPAERREEQMRLAKDLLDRLQAKNWGSDNYPTPYEISQLGRWPGAGKDDWWIGKAVLVGSSWYGVTQP